jgi:glycine cleavage system H protein
MSNIPKELKYSNTHEWARTEEDGTITIGITDHAQELLGDVVFLEFPEVDSEVNAGDEAGVVESVKAASDIYAPISGTVIAVNDALEQSPGLINSDPYGEGWLFRIEPAEKQELNKLLTADAYSAQVVAEGH